MNHLTQNVYDALLQVGINDKEDYNCIQTYSLKQGIKKSGDQVKHAARKEMKQLHGRVVFEPIDVNYLTKGERKREMGSLIFLTKKRDGSIKAQTCANGSTQSEYVAQEESKILTAATRLILMTGVIDAKQVRDAMTPDIPNAFVQANIPKEDEKLIMNIRGQLVDILLEICPGVYDKYVTQEVVCKVFYVRILNALYGMVILSILY